jgi:large subunit ribosomal protein L9
VEDEEGVSDMKVILTAEVKGKGHEGDVVDVTRGYAVNYLLPR